MNYKMRSNNEKKENEEKSELSPILSSTTIR